MNVEVKKVKLNEIKINPNNPRLIKDYRYKKLLQSLKDFPEMLQLREIVVDENYMILGGNQRYRALKELNEKDCIAKIVTGLTDEKKREFIIRDNVEFGENDWDILANEWDSELLNDWGVELPFGDGFERPVYEGDIETPKCEKNSNYFIVEYYNDTDKFNQLKNVLHDSMKGNNEIDNNYFYNLITNTNE